ncbi:FixH family protein [uncultured Erythrobacter sp.]|uniref:FixH family protein n=1 Tax=uncultured Erythrobacter sp. TaxID=263913 RepID=UPI00262EE251|nr:FixH family protein [uncultured Erythrobacter sp.]
MAVQRRPFTGKHMAAILVVGFGVVAAVNFFMASHAVGGFHGIVVENSYVASQKFNGYLEQAEASRALGWEANAARDEAGHVVLTTSDVPEGALITAKLRRPIGEQEFAELTFGLTANGQYRSSEPVTDGRWTMRLTITAGQNTWVEESEL